VLALAIAVGICIQFFVLADLQQENNFYNKILLVDVKLSEYSISNIEATEYYNAASLNYEQQNWVGVETNCKLARGKYSEHMQKLREVSASLEDESEKLFTIKNDMIGEYIIIDESMFEACEHFESASRYYSYYWKSSTPSNDPSFESGGNEIDAMNVKIRAHDEAVRRHNDLLAKYTLKLESLLL